MEKGTWRTVVAWCKLLLSLFVSCFTFSENQFRHLVVVILFHALIGHDYVADATFQV